MVIESWEMLSWGWIFVCNSVLRIALNDRRARTFDAAIYGKYFFLLATGEEGFKVPLSQIPVPDNGHVMNLVACDDKAGCPRCHAGAARFTGAVEGLIIEIFE